VRQGEELVEVVAEGTLGTCPSPSNCPESRRCVGGRTNKLAQAAWKTVVSRHGAMVGVLGFFQIRAWRLAWHEMQRERGYAYARA